MKRCLTCGGTYEPTLPDGSLYFHACPPLSVRELAKGLRDGTVQIPRHERERVRLAREADKANPVPEGEPTRLETVLATIVVERPNKRDENVQAIDTGERMARRVKAEGLGAEDVPDAN